MNRVRLRPERSAAVTPCAAPAGARPKLRRTLHPALTPPLEPALRSASRRFLAAVGIMLSVVVVGCADDPLGDLKAPLVTGTAGRQRFVVTLAGAAPDLSEYRRLLKEDPARVGSYVDERRAALVRPDVEAAIASVNGRVVERWWMSGQLTVELGAEGVARVRAVAGVTAVEPDMPLR